MALIKCDECANEVSTTAKTCPKCGAKVVDPNAAKNGAIGCGILFGFFFVIFILIKACSGPDTPKTAAEIEEGNRSSAFYMCQEFIKKRLRDPDSAEFITRYDTSLVAKDGKGIYSTLMQLRAANGFGGKTISIFTCKLHPTSGDEWRLDDIQEVG